MSSFADFLGHAAQKMREGIIVIDTNGIILYANRATELLFSLSTEPANKPIEIAIRSAPLQRLLVEVIEQQAERESEISIDSNEQERVLSVFITPLSASQSAYLIVASDITKLKKLETVRTDFIANVSHELKTPITIIRGAVETLLESQPEDPDIRSKFLQSIAKQTSRLNALFEDLLSLSKIEQEKSQLQIRLQVTPVKSLFLDILADNKSIAADKGVILAYDCEDTVAIQANPTLITQAIHNLVQNAIEHTPPGGTISLAASKHGGASIRIDVSDTGCGIPGEHLDRIFERFYRVDESRSRKLGGTGLGLSIVKHIAQIHGGSVLVESTVGSGSRFSLLLNAASYEE